jgi:hypothetical protein
LLSSGDITLSLSGSAATADGLLVDTQVLVFLGDDEGTSRTIPGFVGGTSVTVPVLPP